MGWEKREGRLRDVRMVKIINLIDKIEGDLKVKSILILFEFIWFFLVIQLLNFASQFFFKVSIVMLNFIDRDLLVGFGFEVY